MGDTNYNANMVEDIVSRVTESVNAHMIASLQTEPLTYPSYYQAYPSSINPSQVPTNTPSINNTTILPILQQIKQTLLDFQTPKGSQG